MRAGLSSPFRGSVSAHIPSGRREGKGRRPQRVPHTGPKAAPGGGRGVRRGGAAPGHLERESGAGQPLPARERGKRQRWAALGLCVPERLGRAGGRVRAGARWGGRADSPRSGAGGATAAPTGAAASKRLLLIQRDGTVRAGLRGCQVCTRLLLAAK